MLGEAEDAQLESLVRTPEEAAEFVRERFLPPEGRPRAN
jgi:hypothetical protein